MKGSLFRNLCALMFGLAALLAAGDVAAQNASEAREIRKLSYEEKLARWNSMSDEQKEAIRQKARSMSEKKFKQLENNFERVSNFAPAEQKRVKQNLGRVRQFRPQQQENLRQRFQQFQRLPEERRQQFRRQFIPNFQPEPGSMPPHRPGQWQNQQRQGQAQPPEKRPDHWQNQQQRPGQARPPQGQPPGNFGQPTPGHGDKPNRSPGFVPGVFPDAQNRQPNDKKPKWGERQHPDRQPGGQNGHMSGRPQPGQQQSGIQGNRQPVKPGNDKQPGQPGQTGHPFRPGRSGQQGQNWTPDQNRPEQQSGQQRNPGHFRPQGQPGRFDQPGQRGQFRPDMSGPQGMPPRRPPPFRPRRHGDVREFRRGMMGDGSRAAGDENIQRRWQDVEKFREDFNQSETDGQQPHFPGPRRFPQPGRDGESGQQKPENLPEDDMKRPDRPRPPEGMREGGKRPWPGPGHRHFQRPERPESSGQPGGKTHGSDHRPPAPGLKNRPPGKAPAGNPQPKGPKPNPPRKP